MIYKEIAVMAGRAGEFLVPVSDEVLAVDDGENDNTEAVFERVLLDEDEAADNNTDAVEMKDAGGLAAEIAVVEKALLECGTAQQGCM